MLATLAAFWIPLLVFAVLLLVAQAAMIRRIRRSRAAQLYPEEELLPSGVLRLLDRPVGRKPHNSHGRPPVRVVVATRDRRFRRVAHFLLARQGYTVELSRGVDAALELAERDAADVVLIDGSDSLLAAARTLRRLAEQPRSVAAVVVSDADAEPPQTLPTLPKWGAFDEIVAAIETTRAAGSSG